MGKRSLCPPGSSHLSWYFFLAQCFVCLYICLSVSVWGGAYFFNCHPKGRDRRPWKPSSPPCRVEGCNVRFRETRSVPAFRAAVQAENLARCCHCFRYTGLSLAGVALRSSRRRGLIFMASSYRVILFLACSLGACYLPLALFLSATSTESSGLSVPRKEFDELGKMGRFVRKAPCSGLSWA